MRVRRSDGAPADENTHSGIRGPTCEIHCPHARHAILIGNRPIVTKVTSGPKQNLATQPSKYDPEPRPQFSEPTTYTIYTLSTCHEA